MADHLGLENNRLATIEAPQTAFEKGIARKTKMTVNRIIATGHSFDSWLRLNRKIIHEGVTNPHLYALGESGSGKTRLGYFMLIQDIKYAIENSGSLSVVCYDPHGDLYRNLLNYVALLSEQHPITDNIVLIEPVNQQRGAIGINVLETFSGHPYEVVDELISAFKSIWRDAWGARMEDILRHSFLLCEEANLTLASIPRLLTDTSFRKAVVDRSQNRDVRLYWQQHFDTFRNNDQKLFVESSRNKISAFISNPYIKPILGQQKSTINFYKALNEGKIFLINLSRSHLKTESRRLFGILLFAKIHQAIIARDELPEEQRTPVSIYCDEMHEIFHPDFFLPILEGGRKYKAALNLFHQSLSQLDEDYVDIALGNCATQLCFNVGRQDAERMAKELFSFSGERVKYWDGNIFTGKKGKPTYYSVQEEVENAIREIMSQRVGECYIKLKGRKNTDPLVANTIPVEYPPLNPELEEKLREISASHYNRPLRKIYKELEEMEAAFSNKAAEALEEPASYRE